MTSLMLWVLNRVFIDLNVRCICKGNRLFSDSVLRCRVLQLLRTSIQALKLELVVVDVVVIPDDVSSARCNWGFPFLFPLYQNRPHISPQETVQSKDVTTLLRPWTLLL